MQKIIDLLKRLPNPRASWMAIEKELLAKDKDFFSMGGQILQTVPQELRSNQEIIEAIGDLSSIILDRFKAIYKNDPGEWNNHRLNVRKAVFGLI